MDKDKLVIVCDTREKDHCIRKSFEAYGVKTISKKLDFGDYSFIYDDVDFSSQYVFERKMGFDEIINNLTREKHRFYREFHRARTKTAKVDILIEQTITDLFDHNYRSKMKPHVVKAMLDSFQHKYLVKINMISKAQASTFILKKIYKYWREL